MKELTEVESYLNQLQQDQRNIPQRDRASYPKVQAVNDAFAVLTRATDTLDFIEGLARKKNTAIYSEDAYLEELKSWYASIINYARN